MAKAITAEQVTRLWAERGAAAAETVKAGVNSVQENPATKAAARADYWLQRVQQSKQKFIDSLNRVTLQQWKMSMMGKGLQNMQNAYNDPNTQNKFLTFMREWLPYVRSGAQAVKTMPRGTLQQSIDRAAAMIRHNAAFRKGGGGLPLAPMPRPAGQ